MSEFGILGYGFVGKATHLGLLDNCIVSIHDILLDTSIEDLKDCKYVFVCLPTSTSADVSNLTDAIVLLKQINRSCLIILRSTVPVGISNQLEQTINEKIIYMPEFLRERFWNIDCFRRPLIVAHNGVSLPEWLTLENIIECSLEEAEILKMFSNNYAALRIVFANHFYELSQLKGTDYNAILKLYNLVEHDQTYLEANEDLRGFGGKCLPKDLDFIISSFDELGLPQSLLSAIKQDNTLWKSTVKKS